MMGDQPTSLLVGEGIIAAMAVTLLAVLLGSWLMGRSNQAQGLREAAPNQGDVPSQSHVPGSLGR